MAASVAELLIRIDATTETLRRELARADKAVESANSSMIGKMVKFEQRANKTMAAAAKAAGLLSVELASAQVTGDAAYGKLIKAADNYGKAQARANAAVTAFVNEQIGLSSQIGRSAADLKEYEQLWVNLFDEQENAITKSQIALNTLKAQYDPLRAEISKYGAEVTRVSQILEAANATENERKTILAAVNAQYDPAERSVREFAEQQEVLRLKSDAATKALEAQRAAMIEGARATQVAEDAQRTFNQTLGVGQTASGSAKQSASAFQSIFDREDADAAKAELASQWQAILVTEEFAQQERIQQTKQATAENWQAMLIAEQFAAQEAKAQLANEWRAMLIQEEMAQRERIQQTKQAVAQNWAAQMAMEDMDRASNQIEAYRRLATALDPLTAATDRYNKELAELRAGAAAAGTSATRLAELESRLKTKYDENVAAIKRTSSAGVTGFKSLGQAAQQGGYQIQDFFIQVAGGQNVLVAFAQQASQLLGFFGAGGALAGAALSIGAVVIQMLSLSETTKEAAEQAAKLDTRAGDLSNGLNEQAKTLTELVDQYNKATSAQRELIRLDLARTFMAATKEARDQKRELSGLLESAIALTGATKAARDAMSGMNISGYINELAVGSERQQALASRILDSSIALNEMTANLETTRAAIQTVGGQSGAASNDIKGLTENIGVGASAFSKLASGADGFGKVFREIWSDIKLISDNIISPIIEQIDGVSKALTNILNLRLLPTVGLGQRQTQEPAVVTSADEYSDAISNLSAFERAQENAKKVLKEANKIVSDAEEYFREYTKAVDDADTAVRQVVGSYDEDIKITKKVKEARADLTAAMKSGNDEAKAQIIAAGGIDVVLANYEKRLRETSASTKKQNQEQKEAVAAIERVISAYDDEQKITFKVAEARKYLDTVMAGGNDSLKATISAMGGADKILKDYENDLVKGTSSYKAFVKQQEDAEKATKRFADVTEDARRALMENANGVDAVEKAYRPYASIIEKINDLRKMDALTQQQLIELDLLEAVALEDGETARRKANEEIEKTIENRRKEIALLKQQNDLNERVLAGGNDAIVASVEIEDNQRQQKLDDQLEQWRDSLKDADGVLRGVNKTLFENIEAELNRESSLERQAAIQKSANNAAESVTDVLTALKDGDWEGAAVGITSFAKGIVDLNARTKSVTETFAQLGESLLNSAEAGNVLGNMLGDLLGRSEAQNKNAQIGSTIATTAGSFLGIPEGISSFVGNIVGGLFGPGKTDATAGVDVYTGSGDYVTFDTSAKKQSAENMAARDELTQSILDFSDLISDATGGTLAKMVSVEVGSREGNRWRIKDESGALLSSGTTDVGDIEGTLSQILDAMVDTLEGVDDDLKAKLQSIDFTDLEQAESDINFVLNYADAIKTLNGELDGGSDAVSTARQNVVDMVNEVRDFAEQAARLGYDTGETADALRTYVEQFAGLAETTTLTDIQTQIAALEASFEELPPLLELVGYSSEEAATAMAAGLAKAKEALKADFVGSLDQEYNSLIGNDYINEVSDLIASRATDLIDAAALGVDSALVERNFQAALGGILTTDLRIDQLEEAIRLFGDIPGVTEAATSAINDLANATDDAANTAKTATEIANERSDLETQILELEGNTLAIRQKQLDALDPSNRALQEYIYSLEDAADAASKAAEIESERQDLESRILDLQGNTAELRNRELEALDPSNRALQQFIYALEDFETAAAAASKEAEVTASLADRVASLMTGNDYDASIKALERQQNAEFAAAIEAGYTADQLRVLADVLAGEMTNAVDELNDATIRASESLQARLLAALASNPLLTETEVAALEAQATLIERNRELADATSDAERAMLQAIYAAEDQALANQTLADAAAEAAEAAEEAADALERMRSLGGSIREWIDNIRTGSIEGYLSPQEQLANARAQYETQLALAQGGNEDALGSITDYAQKLIEAQQAVYGSGTASQELISGILGGLEDLPAVKSYDQQQLELLQEIADNTSASAESLANADLNGDTVISWPEFQAWSADNAASLDLIAQILGVQGGSLEDIFQAVDTNGDGLISAVERVRISIIDSIGGLQNPSATEIATALAPYFNAIDVDSSGGLSYTEFKSALSGLATDSTLLQWFKELDANGDGMIHRQELTTAATNNLSGGAEGTLSDIAKLTYAGNLDQLNIWSATNAHFASIGNLLYAANVNRLNLINGTNNYLKALDNRVASLHTWLGQVWASEATMLDKIRYNTAGTAKALNGAYSYASGTDYHPGGLAMVGEEGPELVSLPRGAQVMTAPETARFMNNAPQQMQSSVRSSDASTAEEIASSVMRLEDAMLKIAKAQARQSAGEFSEQTGVLRSIDKKVGGLAKTNI